MKTIDGEFLGLGLKTDGKFGGGILKTIEGRFFSSLGLKTESVNVSERSMADGIRGVSKRDSAGSMRA